MVKKVIANFEVQYLQVLDEKGELDAKLMPKLSDKQIKELYELMVFTRVFDDTCLKLQREGRIGTYASMRGEEASIVAPAFALEETDWVFPSFRENTAQIMRGVSPAQLLMYWAGDLRGNSFALDAKALPIYIPVSTQIPHAVGFAWGFKLRKEKSVVIVYFGDGATSRGDFYEAMNFAGTFKIPVVFICMNNQWAISVPRSRQSAAQTLAQKAIAAGFGGIQVDGNDVFAVYSAVEDAVERARAGKGPTLVECFTYRMEHHTTADESSRYRNAEEVEAWKKRDPIDRLQKYLKKKKIWTIPYEDMLQSQTKVKVNDAVKKAEAVSKPSPQDIFDFQYAKLPDELKKQKEELK